NGDIDTRRQIEFLQLINSFGRRFDNVDQALVRALFEGFLRLLVRVRRALDGKALDARRQGNRTGDTRPRAFDGVGDVAGGLIYDAMVIGLEANANALSSHTKNNCLLMVF